MRFIAAVLAAVALCAHLLVAAHSVSHLDQPLAGTASQHCALCAVGKQLVGARTAVVAVWQDVATWAAELSRLPAAALPGVEGATLARGPPFSAFAPIG